MNSTEHTALPWRIGDAGQTVFGPPNGTPCPKIVATTTRANAAYIAQACNAYPALVEALDFMVRMCDAEPATHIYTSHIERARAALAQAQGEK